MPTKKLRTFPDVKIYFSVLITAFFILFLFNGCDDDRVFDENQEIENGSWDQNNKKTFNIDIQDSISWHTIYLNVRNAGAYPFSNLFLFVSTQSPKGLVERDTVECTLADETGKWLGNGIGDLWDNQIGFKRMVRFPMKGIYKIQLEQAMRVNPLPYIMDVGIRVEKVKVFAQRKALLKK